MESWEEIDVEKVQQRCFQRLWPWKWQWDEGSRKKNQQESFKIENPCFTHFMESWNFDFYKEIDLPECTGNGDGPECGGGGSLLNGGRGWGSILSVSSLWGDFDGSWLLDLEEGGVRMTSGPDETDSVLVGFFFRLNEPNVELLLKTNQGAHEELIFHLWTAACFWRCFWSNSSSPAPFQVALLGDFELK